MQSINVEYQLIEHFDKKNVLGCVSRKSDRERIKKINSKPCCFESERGLVFKVDTQPLLTHWLDMQK